MTQQVPTVASGLYHATADSPITRSQKLLALVIGLACLFSVVLIALGPTLVRHSDENQSFALFPENLLEPALQGVGFLPDAVYPTTSHPVSKSDAKRCGSWLGSDDSQGDVKTRWYRYSGPFQLQIAGYPDAAQKKLTLEWKSSLGKVSQSVYVPTLTPGETWQSFTIQSPVDCYSFRRSAVDHATGQRGWFGFSEPFTVHRSYFGTAAQVLLLMAAASAAFTLFIGPGLLIRLRRAQQHSLRPELYWLIIPGFLTSAFIGLFIWKGAAVPAYSRGCLYCAHIDNFGRSCWLTSLAQDSQAI